MGIHYRPYNDDTQKINCQTNRNIFQLEFTFLGVQGGPAKRGGAPFSLRKNYLRTEKTSDAETLSKASLYSRLRIALVLGSEQFYFLRLRTSKKNKVRKKHICFWDFLT